MGPVVVATGVFGADLSAPFVTVAELRFGALRAGWGTKRRNDLAGDDRSNEDRLARARPDPRVRVPSADCFAAGHGLAEKSNDADR